MHRLASVGFAVLFILGMCCSGGAFAQATRTWVSGVGDDANPCSRTAPCKTFAGAISKTAAGGVIDALDPGGFGAVTITKAITIESDGALASVLVSGTNGIIINAGVNDAVVIRNIKITGLGTGLDGIRFLAGGSLLVEGTSIEGFANTGINFIPSNAATLTVRGTTLRGNGKVGGNFGGINVQPGAAGSARGSLDDVHFVRNTGFGLVAGSSAANPPGSDSGPVSLAVRNSVASTNAGNGFAVIGGSATAQLMLDNVLSADNESAGVIAIGGNALIRMSGSTLHGNTQGIQATVGGQVVSFGDNRNRGNISDGAPTSTIARQ
ncbi:MAG: right-handed parallel beta-helix repeat-containing protein [Xanthomonadales bacterium]|nr:right-handed parallel beta-helix repeat-containing protein [Xanthomonadales bacterium]